MDADCATPSSQATTFQRIYRGTLFQIIILGLVSFTQPGIWTTLSNLGAGGLAKPFFANPATLITYLIMFFLAPLFSIAINRFNVKWVLIFGTLGYAPWSASLYCNSVYGTQWFMILGAVTCGISASALWVSESAIAVGYPERGRRGLYISIWLALNKIGNIVGTALVFLYLYSYPKSLIRTDGTKAAFVKRKFPSKKDFKTFGESAKSGACAFLVPIFFTWQWGQAQQGMYLTTYFTVAGRVVAGFVVTWVSILADLAYGWFMDSKIVPRRSLRAKVSLASLCLLYTATYIYNFVTQAEFDNTKPVFNYTDPGYARAVAVYCLWRIPNEGLTVWLYWVLGTFNEDVNTLAHTTALLRAFESLGQAIPYGIASNDHVSIMTHLGLAAGTFWLSVPTTVWSAMLVTDEPDEGVFVGAK